MNDEVGPQVADHPGDLPVKEGEVEDAGREQVDQLVSMGHTPRDKHCQRHNGPEG